MSTQFTEQLLVKSAELFASYQFETYDTEKLRRCYSKVVLPGIMGVVQLHYGFNRGVLLAHYSFGIRFEEVSRIKAELFSDDKEILDSIRSNPLATTVGELSVDYRRSWIDRRFIPCAPIQSDKQLSKYLKEIEWLITKIIQPYFRANSSIPAASQCFRRKQLCCGNVDEVLIYVLNQEYDYAESVVNSRFLKSRSGEAVIRGNRLLEYISKEKAVCGT